MIEPLRIQRRRPRGRDDGHGRRPSLALALAPGPGGSPASFAYPGIPEPEEGSRRTLLTGSFAALLHLGAVGLLVLLASLAPVIQEELVPVRLLREQPPTPETPAPAPRALAERRLPNFAPQVQSVAPQVVNPRVMADAAPAVRADSLALEALSAVVAPAQIERRSLAVEHVARVNSIASARAAAVDVPQAVGPAVRGPVRIDAPAGPSVGPRQVAAQTAGRTLGTASFEIGGAGSSVKEGVASSRDVIGSPDGAPLARVDTAVGEGFLRGSGGSGTGLAPAGAASDTACRAQPEVQAYLTQIHERMMARWRLPPGVSDSEVSLRFQVDVAGSAQHVEFVAASSNALGASAVDAMRSASPFPPIPERARCLADQRILGRFRATSDGAG